MSKLLVTILIIGLVLGTLWYVIYQYQLCYPEVSKSALYCLRHAGVL